MRGRPLLYFALGVTTVLGMGQVTNQIATPAVDETDEVVVAGAHADGGIVVNGAVVETKADPPCYPSATDPAASYRYIDCGNGTVLDTVTGLLWLRDANCLKHPPPFAVSGEIDWFDALALASTLEDGECGLTDKSQPGDWRLPSQAEWEATTAEAVDMGCTSPALVNDLAGNCLEDGPTSFIDVEDFGNYWSSTSTSGVGVAGSAWAMYMWDGAVDGPPKGDVTDNFFWPVRER